MSTTLWQDVRFGFRMLMRKPAFTLTAVLTLALGIGANTSIFSVVNAILLKPLPYLEPARLVWMETMKARTGQRESAAVSPADFWEWKEQSQTFEEIAAFRGEGISLKDAERPEALQGARVSTNFFQALGIAPVLGRAFANEEGRLGAPMTIVISHRLWQRRFGGDPSIVGRTIERVEGPTTVIGVMPPDFRFPSFAEAWVPFSRDSSEMQLRSRYFQVFGRLKNGQSLESAQAEMATITSRLESSHPESNKGLTARLTPLKERLTGETRPALLVLLGAVGFVLLIACANVANLLLARAATRRKEMVIRLALGASRAQLMQQLLIESVLLALVGGAIGLLLAVWGVDLLIGLLPQSKEVYQLPNAVRIDGVVLGFTLLVSVLTGLLFGLVPGWQASRPNVNEWLKEGSHATESARRQRTRAVLIVTEFALALVLLIGAGLLIQSFVRLRSVELGYEPHGLLTMWISAPFSKYHDDESRARLYTQVLEQVRQVPGVEGATVTSGLPFGFLSFPFNIEGDPLPSGDVNAHYSAISPGYFNVLKAPLTAGRDFTERDDRRSTEVAIINEALARQYFNGRDPLGQKISIAYMGKRAVREVVGVVGNIKQDELGKPSEPEIYVPYQQQPWLGQALVIRTTTADPLTLKNDVQRAIWAVDQDQPVSKAETVDQMLSNLVAEPRLYTLLLGIFAALALLLAAIGIYGVMSYSVTQRTHEIGVRMALGAQPRDILRMIVSQAMTFALVGVAIGVAASLALTRLLSSFLYGVSKTDPLTFVIVSLGLVGVAFLASFIPARRATHVDPMEALRYE
ncbi:MAG TPA: ABC transporter permease [Pyrinomonadaceae bacterium]|nr:ABC transporter permease [Pyrinomonadaceae bacterium]